MIVIYYAVSQNVLYHHGILGQRWGVRRYQNKDGTRTAAGKRRARANREFVKSETIDLKTGKVVKTETAEKSTESSAAKVKEFVVKHKKAVLVTGGVATYAALHKIGQMNVNKDNTVKAYAKVGAQTLEKGIKEGVKDGLLSGSKKAISTVISGSMMRGTKNLMDMYVGKDTAGQIFNAANSKKVSSFWKYKEDDKNNDED